MPTNDQILAFFGTYGLFLGGLIVLFVIVAAGIPLIRKLWPKVKTFVDTVDIVANLPKSLGNISDKLTELKTESGEKKDRLDKIETKLGIFDSMASAAAQERGWLRDQLALQAVDISVIRHEVQHNNGGSVKDAVRRLEQGQSRIEQHLGLPPVEVVVAAPTP